MRQAVNFWHLTQKGVDAVQLLAHPALGEHPLQYADALRKERFKVYMGQEHRGSKLDAAALAASGDLPWH